MPSQVRVLTNGKKLLGNRFSPVCQTYKRNTVQLLPRKEATPGRTPDGRGRIQLRQFDHDSLQRTVLYRRRQQYPGFHDPKHRPGSYRPTDSKYGYLDQTGDIKFEANLEYRFPILGDLHGATFLDAGNVWLLRYDKSRPGGQLKWGRFLKDLALGTGIGLRYDLTFLVIRLDWGIGLHVPYETGKKGYYNIPDFKDGMGVHLAIGYPF